MNDEYWFRYIYPKNLVLFDHEKLVAPDISMGGNFAYDICGKFYQTTTSDEQMAMAFETEDLFSLIDEIVNSLYEGMEYDDYQVSKYILARRILDGTITAKQIPDFENISTRDMLAFIKGHSNKMTFRKPFYNPAGIRKATKFDDQFAILDSMFEAKVSTTVLATSYFKDEAEMRAHAELCDSFGEFDMPRLAEVFGKRDANGDLIPGEYLDGYVPLTDAEMLALQDIPCVIVGRDFFQNRKFGTEVGSPSGKATDFFNPQTLRRDMSFLIGENCIAISPELCALRRHTFLSKHVNINNVRRQ